VNPRLARQIVKYWSGGSDAHDTGRINGGNPSLLFGQVLRMLRKCRRFQEAGWHHHPHGYGGAHGQASPCS